MNDSTEKTTFASGEDQGDAEKLAEEERSPVDDLQSLTRLVIGGVEVGVEELFRLLRAWEQQAVSDKILPLEDDASLEEKALALPSGESHSEKALESLRYALIGLIFETQDRAKGNLKNLGTVSSWVGGVISPWLKPLRVVSRSPLLSPVRERYDQLAARGQVEVARWIELGRAEDAHSRELVRVAFDETVDDYIEYLTTNPEVKELVEQQSTGLATEVIEEVRERTVSVDHFLEGIARSLLHRSPRSTLPATPVDIRMSAQISSLKKKATLK